MKKNLKIERELLFKNNIKEITSISLDSDYKINNSVIEGNFIIEGDYKIHEVSINREKFNFKIPFKLELDKDIDEETIKLEIINFEYDYRKDELLVNIEYNVTGDRKDIFVFEDKESLDEFMKNKEVEVISDRIELLEEVVNESNELNEEIKKDIPKLKPEVIEENNKIEEIRNDDKKEIIASDEIINKIDKPKDNFITYQVYKIKENDTLESIVLKYKTTIDELKEYNDLTNVSINDKIIIPYYE